MSKQNWRGCHLWRRGAEIGHDRTNGLGQTVIYDVVLTPPSFWTDVNLALVVSVESEGIQAGVPA